MNKHYLKIAWVLFLFFLSAGYVFLFKYVGFSGPFVAIPVSFFALGVAIWVYLLFRILIFRRKLVNFLKFLLEGNYAEGLKIAAFAHDEIYSLVKQINKSVEQLKIIDSLRAEKVALNYNALDQIFCNVKEGVILADLEKKIFQLNEPARLLFEIGPADLNFELLEKQEANKQFWHLFTDVVLRKKVTLSQKVFLLPSLSTHPKEVFVKIIPIKNKLEEVKFVVILVERAAGEQELLS